MTHASKAGPRLLLGVVALLCLGVLLWLAPWESARPEGGLEVLQRSDAFAIGAPGQDQALPGIGQAKGRRPDQVSAEALAAAEAEAARAEANGPAAQLIGRVVGPAGEPLAAARVLATTGRSAGSSLGMELEDRELRSVCSAESGDDGEFRIGVAEGVPELEEGRTVSALIRASGWVVQSRRLGRFPGRLPMVIDPIVMEPGAAISGRVIGPDGLAAEGATVYFGQSATVGGLRVSAPSRGYPLGTTGSDGAFRCDELAPGAFHLVVEKPGHPVAFFEGEATLGRELEGVTVRLDRGDSITGSVKGAGTRASSLWISVWPAGDDAPAVDRRPRGVAPASDGAFELTGLRPGGEYVLTLHSSRGARRRRGRDGERVVAVSGARGVQLVWTPRSSVGGRVVGLTDGAGAPAPLEQFVLWHTFKTPKDDLFSGEALEVDGEVVAVHPDGRFLIEGLRLDPGSTGQMALRIRAPGFEQLVRLGVAVPHAADVDLGEIALAPAPGLRVRVVEAGSERPLDGARVFLAAQTERKSLGRWRLRDTPAHGSTKTRYAETDATGYALLQLPKKRPWIVFANADGFPVGEFRTVAGEEEVVVLELVRGSSLAAEVVDLAGNPLKGVEVSMRVSGEEGGSIWLPRRVVRTDAAGVALFEHIEAGVATVRAEPPRMRPRQPKAWQEAVERVEVSEGEELAVRLVMPLSAELRGRVRLGGAPLPDARLRLAVDEGGQILRPDTTSDTLRAITNEDGEFALQGVPTGTYAVTVSHRSLAMASVFTYEVRPEPSELVVDLVETRVSGRVVLEGTGEPARGVQVRVAGPTQLHRAWIGQRALREDWWGGMDSSDRWLEPGKLTTGEDGTFEFAGITPGVPVSLELSGELIRAKTESLGVFDEGTVREEVILEVEAGASLRVVAENSARRRGGRSGRSRAYGIRLRALDQRMRDKVVKSFRGSSHRFISLRPGRYSVETIDLGAEGAPAIEAREVTLVGGERAEVTMPGL